MVIQATIRLEAGSCEDSSWMILSNHSELRDAAGVYLSDIYVWRMLSDNTSLSDNEVTI